MNLELRNAKYIDFSEGRVKEGSIFIDDDGYISPPIRADRVIDCEGNFVLPGIVDSHTHSVFYGKRVDEFELKLKGVSYQEIHRRGGGIQSTVNAVRGASEEEIFNFSKYYIERMFNYGVTTVEIKSGYGLDLENELKLLRVIRRIGEEYRDRVDVIPTYLVHKVPEGWNRDDYVRYVTEEVLPAVKEGGYALFVDIFCDEIGFTADESYRILGTSRDMGFKIKMHLDQFSDIGGDRVALELGAVSVDHLENTRESSLNHFKEKGVVPVLLPSCSLFTNIRRLPAVSYMQNNRIEFAIASDFNPGSSPIFNPYVTLNIGVHHYRIEPLNAVKGMTYMGARALDLKDRGAVEVGYTGDIVVTSIRDYREIFYHFITDNFILYVIKGGKVYETSSSVV